MARRVIHMNEVMEVLYQWHQGAGIKAITEWMPKQNRALAMGVFDGGSAVGAIIAPPLVAWLSISFGWRATFVATGALGLVWLVLWLLVYRPGISAVAGPAAPVRMGAGLELTRTIS